MPYVIYLYIFIYVYWKISINIKIVSAKFVVGLLYFFKKKREVEVGKG